MSPLLRAVKNRNIANVELLVEKKAKLSVTDQVNVQGVHDILGKLGLDYISTFPLVQILSNQEFVINFEFRIINNIFTKSNFGDNIVCLFIFCFTVIIRKLK